MAEQELDRSEDATPFKRQQARKKGTVTRSQDVSTAVAAAALLLVMVFFGCYIMHQALALFQACLVQPITAIFNATQLLTYGWQALAVLSPLWLTLLILPLLSGTAQVGFIISSEALKPDWKRLSLAQGLKRLFSLRMLFEGLKTSLKFILFIIVLYWAIKGLWPKLLPLSLSHVSVLAQALGLGTQQIITKLLAALILIAVFDWLYVRREVTKKLRMSRRERRDEVKQHEGDPRIKAKLSEIRRQFLQRTQSVGRVKEADVLIVNPQHLAIAIKYQREEMQAPQVLAKGAGDIALKMREVAHRSGVPVLENKALARSLFRELKIDDWIPEAYYAAVAKALVWAFRVRRHSTGRNF
jgi:flagellar biosynthetic protein FlhB